MSAEENEMIEMAEEMIEALDRAANVAVQRAAHLTTTVRLGCLNHPSHERGWPNWAALAMVHTMSGFDDKDMFVTWASDAEIFSNPSLRSEIHGIQIQVLSLYTWDWGPVEHPVSSIVTTIHHGDKDANS